jgi:hypothetical protein
MVISIEPSIIGDEPSISSISVVDSPFFPEKQHLTTSCRCRNSSNSPISSRFSLSQRNSSMSRLLSGRKSQEWESIETINGSK